jgi:biotin carboxyl carrier protein
MGLGMPSVSVASGEAPSTSEDQTYTPAHKKSTALMRSAMKKKTGDTPKKAAVVKNPVKAPLPGLILNIKVNVGDSVNAGDVVLIMEAMKMENEIRAHAAGSITQILCENGQSVNEGDPLIDIG